MDTLKIDTLNAAQDAAGRAGLTVKCIAGVQPRVYVAEVVGMRAVLKWANWDGEAITEMVPLPAGAPELKAGDWCATARAFCRDGHSTVLVFECVKERDEAIL